MKLEWGRDPFRATPELEPPEGGWRSVTCSFESHGWALEIDNGSATVQCVDPCDPDLFDPAGKTPVCLCGWEPEDFHTPEPIPVKVTYVDDSTPPTPAGPAEYGYYLEVRSEGTL